jgi:hypothetical protein
MFTFGDMMAKHSEEFFKLFGLLTTSLDNLPCVNISCDENFADDYFLWKRFLTKISFEPKWVEKIDKHLGKKESFVKSYEILFEKKLEFNQKHLKISYSGSARSP